jgi:hypothetical protein
LDKIKSNFRNIDAKRIQRTWKRYLIRKENKRVADLMRQVAVETAKEEIVAEKQKKFLSRIPNPLGGLTNGLGNLYKLNFRVQRPLKYNRFHRNLEGCWIISA